jgi:hypothetical protein
MTDRISIELSPSLFREHSTPAAANGGCEISRIALKKWPANYAQNYAHALHRRGEMAIDATWVQALQVLVRE